MMGRFFEMTKGDCLDRHLAIIGNMLFPRRATPDPVSNVSLSGSKERFITRQTITARLLVCRLAVAEVVVNSQVRREEVDL